MKLFIHSPNTLIKRNTYTQETVLFKELKFFRENGECFDPDADRTTPSDSRDSSIVLYSTYLGYPPRNNRDTFIKTYADRMTQAYDREPHLIQLLPDGADKFCPIAHAIPQAVLMADAIVRGESNCQSDWMALAMKDLGLLPGRSEWNADWMSAPTPEEILGCVIALARDVVADRKLTDRTVGRYHERRLVMDLWNALVQGMRDNDRNFWSHLQARNDRESAVFDWEAIENSYRPEVPIDPKTIALSQEFRSGIS